MSRIDVPRNPERILGLYNGPTGDHIHTVYVDLSNEWGPVLQGNKLKKIVEGVRKGRREYFHRSDPDDFYHNSLSRDAAKIVVDGMSQAGIVDVEFYTKYGAFSPETENVEAEFGEDHIPYAWAVMQSGDETLQAIINIVPGEVHDHLGKWVEQASIIITDNPAITDRYTALESLFVYP